MSPRHPSDPGLDYLHSEPDHLDNPIDRFEVDNQDNWMFWSRRVEYGTRAWLIAARGNLTTRDIAERSDVDIAYLNDLEDGKRMPQMRTLLKLAVAYGVEPLWLAERFLEEAAR